jgi:hypothetical protein
LISGGKHANIGFAQMKAISRSLAGKTVMSERQNNNNRVVMGNYLHGGIIEDDDACKVNNWVVNDF